jgi:transposase
MTVRLRELTAEEQSTIERLAHSRTASARVVERAGIIWHASQGEVATVIHRFNSAGVAALEDAPRSGRPATYTPEQAAKVVAAALTDPQSLKLPFASWTLDRLAAYLHEEKGVAMKRSRIDEILLKEGLRWHRQETWFGERVDPAFAEKRGASRRSTPPRPRAA